jgi:hypothetical protein
VASTIKIKRSGVANKTPTTADISTGELAINYKDQKLFSSNGTAVFQIGASSGGSGLVSITTATVKNLTQNDTVVTNVGVVAANGYLQVSNAAATYLTKNNPIVTGTLTANGSAGTSGYYLRTSGTGIYWSPIAASSGATWSALLATNTALRTLISDRLQVANAVATYATKSNPTTSGLLAHTGRATISTNLAVSGNATVTGTMTATGVVSGSELTSTLASGDEGGQVNLTKPPNGTLGGGVTIDAYQNRIRIFEQGGSARGVYIDLSTAAAGVGSNLLTNRVVSYTDQNSITINADTTDTATQSYTGAAGTLTINAPTGTLVNGQKILFRLTTTNAQTLSWNAIFRGSTDLSLPTTSSGSSKTDYLAFIYNSASTKWDLLAKNFGY